MGPVQEKDGEFKQFIDFENIKDHIIQKNLMKKYTRCL